MKANSKPATSIAVCIITYLRPIGLSRCLESLASLRFSKNTNVTPRIIVVDNDAEGSARTVVQKAAEQTEWPIQYAVQPERGISFARNQAVALASGCEFIAFVDDDESVAPPWLEELICVQQRYNADVVTGPVISVFESKVPDWISKGHFFERSRWTTGTPLNIARTGNVLIRRSVLNRVSGPFDHHLAVSGGEDSFLFAQLARLGARIVWCDEAIVNEYVPASRANIWWLLQRAYRKGNTIAMTERLMPIPLRRNPIKVSGRAVLRILTALVKLTPALFLGRARVMKQFTEIAFGCGTFFGMAGVRYDEYHRIHGT